MQYAILCYDHEAIVESWTQAEDDAVIAKHRAVEHELAKKAGLARLAADADTRGDDRALGRSAIGARWPFRGDQGAAAGPLDH